MEIVDELEGHVVEIALCVDDRGYVPPQEGAKQGL